MKFATYRDQGEEKIGVLSTDGLKILDINKVAGFSYINMLEFIEQFNEDSHAELQRWVTGDKMDAELFTPLAGIKLCAPIPKPKRNIICLGLNYREHVKESQSVKGSKIPTKPVYFGKMATRIIGPEEEIDSHQQITSEVDYEVELAVVMGKSGENIQPEQVEDYIFGYSIFNDVSARDLQRDHLQWIRGKSLDTFSVMGPYIVHKSGVPFPVELELSSRVNGELRQHSNTKQFIFDLPYIISDLSRGFTLQAGDIIITGTPAGVGMGFQPPQYLRPGDMVECFIEGIGSLRNPIR